MNQVQQLDVAQVRAAMARHLEGRRLRGGQRGPTVAQQPLPPPSNAPPRKCRRTGALMASPRTTRPQPPPARLGQLRIIGGQWRSRRLNFPEAPGLRPTPDRVRETLFNWLAPYVEGARVLDPFAGSGALLLEALSRGAAGALAVEFDPAAAAALRDNLALLRAEGAEVRQGDALQRLQQDAATPFDLAFLDPPFHKDLLAPGLRPAGEPRLAGGGRLDLHRKRKRALDPRPAGQLAPAPREAHRPGSLRPVAAPAALT